MFGGGIFTDFLTLPWEEARGYIKEELEQLRAAINAQLNNILNSDGTISEDAFFGGSGDVPSYLANTGPKKKPKWDKVDLANGVKNRLGYGSLPQADNPSTQSVIAHSNGSNFSEAPLGPDVEITNPDNLLELTETGVTAGTYGDEANIPQITVDEKGRVTEATLIPVDISAEPSDGDKGDVIVSGDGLVWTLDPDDASTTLDGASDPFVRTSAVTSGANGPASVSVLTSGTGATYTVPSGIYRLKVRLVGPGGGGGGADQSAAGCGCGGGGGAGGYAEKIYSTTPGATYTYTVGQQGTGGAAGNNSGNPGTTATVFDSGGTPVTGNVGGGGGSMAVGTSLNSANAGTGGTATGGSVNIAGQAGGTGYRFANANLLGGNGANSPLGTGGFTIHGTTANSATGYGAGGAGAMEFANQTDRAGGNGAHGVIIIEEFN